MFHSLCIFFLSIFTFVELNCENLFDCSHDSLRNDYEYCEGGARYWTPAKYWRKLNNISREIISCGGKGAQWSMPDLVALVEVENDSVLFDLTHRSILRKAGYEFVMTQSNDERGIDVALMYLPYSFVLDKHYSIRVDTPKGYRPTRDILYVRGYSFCDNSSLRFPLHVFVVHAPSRAGGQKATAKYRKLVSDRLLQSVDSIKTLEPDANIIIAGDFNDYSTNLPVAQIADHGFRHVSKGALGSHGAKGTYRFQGEWGSLDHIFVSDHLLSFSEMQYCTIHDEPFLVAPDEKYGGFHPRRSYNGYKYDYDGFSDHLPLVLRLDIGNSP